MTTSEIQSKILKEIPQHFGEPTMAIFKRLKKQAGHDSSSDHVDSKQGYRLFYTANENYAGGKRNGYGRGMYATLQHVGMTSTVKIIAD